MNPSGTGQPQPTTRYEVRVHGHLDRRWSPWLAGMDITTSEDGTTVLRGPVTDPSALHGLLTRILDLGLPLISVARVEADPEHEPTHLNN